MDIEKLALKHQLAMQYSIELMGLDVTNEEIVNRSFDLAQRMLDRAQFELNQQTRKEEKSEHEFDPIEHFINSLMGSIAKSKGQIQ